MAVALPWINLVTTKIRPMSKQQPVTAERVIEKLAELNLTIDSTLPYRLEQMFPRVTGWGSKAEIKARVKLLNAAELTIDKMLLPSEEIIFVSKGVQNSIVEALTIGALWANMINQTVFILTNARLLMAHCDRRGRISEPCWMIYYSEIDSFKTRFTGTVTIKLKTGGKLQFTGFPKTDRKTMPKLFEQVVENYREHGFQPDCSQSRENLCSHCFQVVPAGEFECGECGSQFWKPSEIAMRSALFPAWGDILMKHYPLAIVELLGYVFTWIIVAAAIGEGKYGLAAGLLVAAHGFDALVTTMIARKGLHTRKAGTPG